jgi:uncharacterized membrane protein
LCYHLYPISTLLFCSVGICTLQDGSICDEDKSWVDCEVADGLKDCEVFFILPGSYITGQSSNPSLTSQSTHDLSCLFVCLFVCLLVCLFLFWPCCISCLYITWFLYNRTVLYVKTQNTFWLPWFISILICLRVQIR